MKLILRSLCTVTAQDQQTVQVLRSRHPLEMDTTFGAVIWHKQQATQILQLQSLCMAV